MLARTAKSFRENYDIDVQIEQEVIEVLPQRQSIRVVDTQTKKERIVPYSRLLLATGARPIQPFPEAAGTENLMAIKSLASGIFLKKYLESKEVNKAVIVGGGYIGVELAEALTLRGIRVTILQRGAQVMNSLDPSMAQRVAVGLERHGITLLTDTAVTGFEIQNNKARGVIANGHTIPADLFILGMGVTPNSELGKSAGLNFGPANSIEVDDRLQTNVPNIWAAGDCCQSVHLVSNKPVYIPLGTTANKQGRTAGINIGGGQAQFNGVMGTAITKFMDIECACTGLNTKQLEALGIDFVSGEIDAKTLPKYYPGTSPLTVKLFAERNTRRILGGQIVGGLGSSKRIDTLVMALHAGFTLEDILNIDLSYAPPFGNVWDPLVIAARVVLKQ